jgi:hypothetical protein
VRAEKAWSLYWQQGFQAKNRQSFEAWKTIPIEGTRE